MSIDKLVNYVSMITFNSLKDSLKFKGISDSDVKQLMDSSYKMNLEKGDVLSNAFESAALVFVDDGLVRKNLETADGKIRNCSFFLKGNSFTHYPHSGHSPTKIISLEKTSLTIISGDAIYRLAQSSRLIFDFILREVAIEREFIRDWVILGEVTGKRNHLLYSLLLISISAVLNNKTHLPVKYQDLADMSGTSISYTINVIRDSIEVGAFKKVYNGIEILNPSQILKLVDIEPLESHMEAVIESLSP